LRARPGGVPSGEAGEAFARHPFNLSGAIVSEELTTNERSEESKRGITIGILVVALICLSLFFVWRHFGVAGSANRAAATTTR
jgi:hypothetical protein